MAIDWSITHNKGVPVTYDRVITVPTDVMTSCVHHEVSATLSMDEARSFVGASTTIRVASGILFEDKPSQLLYDAAQLDLQDSPATLNHRATEIAKRADLTSVGSDGKPRPVAIHGPAIVLVGRAMIAPV